MSGKTTLNWNDICNRIDARARLPDGHWARMGDSDISCPDIYTDAELLRSVAIQLHEASLNADRLYCLFQELASRAGVEDEMQACMEAVLAEAKREASS